MFDLRYEDSNSEPHQAEICGDLLGRILPALAEEWARNRIGNLRVLDADGRLMNAAYGLDDYRHAPGTAPPHSHSDDVYTQREMLDDAA